MTNRYRFKREEAAIAKLSAPISQIDMNGTLSVRTDVTVMSSYRRTVRGRDIVYYTVRINNVALHSIFGSTVDIPDINDNLQKIKSKRTRYLSPFK
jgi:hypothetical protein